MYRMSLACIVLGLLMIACGSAGPSVDADRPLVDRPWTAEDERSLEELAAAGDAAEPEGTHLATALDSQPVDDAASEARLLIHIFNIGQADSMLVVGPPPDRKTLLIDLGEPTRNSVLPPSLSSSADHVRRRILEITGKESVDYFVLTHYHSDHAGFGANWQNGWGTGIIQLLSDFAIPFRVGEFVHVGADGASYMKDSKKRGVFQTVTGRMPIWEKYGRVGRSSAPVFGTSQIDLGASAEVDIVAFAGKAPDGTSVFEKIKHAGIDYSETPGNENDLSIALVIRAGNFELFTGGDLNGTDNPDKRPLYVKRKFGEVYANVEAHWIDYQERNGLSSDVEVYRANHHGSPYSSTERLLDALDPEFVIYSTGADSGHPGNSVVQRSARTARQVATTAVKDPTTFRDHRGELVGEVAIAVAADGRSYTINGEEHRAFDESEEAAGDDEGEEDR